MILFKLSYSIQELWKIIKIVKINQQKCLGTFFCGLSSGNFYETWP